MRRSELTDAGAGQPASAAATMQRTDYWFLAALMLVFWWGALRQVELPGLYMDAVNPDYLAARILHPELRNPVWVIPSATIPILGGLYHGVQNLYVDLLVFPLLGINVTSVRIAQALFGAGIVAGLYLLAAKATSNRLAAFAGALLLATDQAFLASFRTQYYIILGAEFWLFTSLLALWRGGRRGYFASGVFLGLATYGYFVLGFFAPAMLLLAATREREHLSAWFSGLLVGLLPYVECYLSFFWAMGVLRSGLEWLEGTIKALAPLSSKASLWDKMTATARSASYALSNTGNEHMILNGALGGRWPELKVWLFAGVFGAALFASIRVGALRLSLLPLSFGLVALIFGGRLDTHHFSVMVPLAYLLLSCLTAQLLCIADRVGKSMLLAVAVVGLGFLLGNVVQSDRFHARLNETGGTRMTTNALGQLAEDARRAPNALYVFPEWGFFMTFALLTENKIPYVLETSSIASARAGRRDVLVAYWSERNERSYADALLQAGARDTVTTVYRQRDGVVAFLLTRGRFD